METFDYIIVGAGTCGCVLAHRLSENPSNTVLLLEAGQRDAHPMIHMPKGISKAMADPGLIWPYQVQAQPGTNNVAEVWARGRTLGGSSSINGMVYVRGQAADYDALAAAAGPDWGWAEIGKAYRALENHELGADECRGDAGPQRISLPAIRTPLAEAAIEAGVALGLKRMDDVNSPEDVERIGYVPSTIYRGARQSAAVAFLKPARNRPNLRVETGVVIDSVIIEGGRATGVRGVRNGSPVAFQAGKEVILSAGALATPAILQRSGVGPAEHLKKAGIQPVLDSPGVGDNLYEHRGVVMQWRVKAKASQNADFQGLRLAANTLGYYLGAKSPMGGAAYDVGAWFKSRPGLDRPDGQILIAPFTFDYGAPSFRVERDGGMNFCVYMLRPKSRGYLRVASPDPASLPEITANYGVEASDERDTVAVLRYARRLAAQAPLADLVEAETRPGPRYESDDELAEAWREFGYGSYHASGTCRMGQDNAAPVDGQARLRGIGALRVVDTSLFPDMPSGNTNGPAMAVAWRASDLILAS